MKRHRTETKRVAPRLPSSAGASRAAVWKCSVRSPATPTPRAEWIDNPTFNDWVDDENPVLQVLDVEFRPSEVLFQMEPETHRVYLADFDAAAEGTDDSGTPDAPTEAGP